MCTVNTNSSGTLHGCTRYRPPTVKHAIREDIYCGKATVPDGLYHIICLGCIQINKQFVPVAHLLQITVNELQVFRGAKNPSWITKKRNWQTAVYFTGTTGLYTCGFIFLRMTLIWFPSKVRIIKWSWISPGDFEGIFNLMEIPPQLLQTKGTFDY